MMYHHQSVDDNQIQLHSYADRIEYPKKNRLGLENDHVDFNAKLILRSYFLRRVFSDIFQILQKNAIILI